MMRSDGRTAMKRILVADDEQVMLALIRHYLEREGFDTVVTDSAADVADFMMAQAFDLVLLDVVMPEMNGYELCASIVRQFPAMPVILVTALADDDALKKGFDAGAADYVRKPIKRMELIARVNNVFRIRDAEKELEKRYHDLVGELETASRVQSYLLPMPVILESGIVFSSHYEPSSHIGGDIYDVIPLPAGRFLVYIGDISGHGVQAALLMSAVKSAVNMIVEEEGEATEPWRVLARLNALASDKLFSENYITMLMGIMDGRERRFTYYNAGHPSPVLWGPASGSRLLSEAGGIPVGWDRRFGYAEQDQHTAVLEDGGTILLHTDGIFECVNGDGDELGQDGLVSLAGDVSDGESCVSFPFALKERLNARGFRTDADDFSLLAVHAATYDDRCFKASRTLESVSETARNVAEAVAAMARDERLAAKAELVFTELATNTLKHGRFYMNRSSVFVDLAYTDRLVMRYYDWQLRWNMEERLNHARSAADAGDAYAESGRGLAIIKDVCRNISYRRLAPLNETVLEIMPG